MIEVLHTKHNKLRQAQENLLKNNNLNPYIYIF